MPKVLPASSSGGGHRARGRRVSTTLAEINVIPLVDVMLVLLIIFMVAAPMLQRGVEVSLPQARQSAPLASEPVFVDVPLSYRQDRRVLPTRIAELSSDTGAVHNGTFPRCIGLRAVISC